MTLNCPYRVISVPVQHQNRGFKGLSAKGLSNRYHNKQSDCALRIGRVLAKVCNSSAAIFQLIRAAFYLT